MASSFSMEQARVILDSGMAQAQELIQNPPKMNELLAGIEAKLKEVPVIGESLANLPLMISMIKSYVTKEYTEVSPKVIALMVSALLYVLKKKDIIPDSIPVLGFVDDIAVLGLALKLSEPEMTAFSQWRDAKKIAEADPQA